VGAGACAITEHGNLHSSFVFQKELSENGIKSINGIEFYYVGDRHKKGVSEQQREELRTIAADKEAYKELVKEHGKGLRGSYHVVCLAKNNRGWLKIIKALEVAHKEGFYYKPRIDEALLLDMAGDVIVLSACVGGVTGKLLQVDDWSLAQDWCRKVKTEYGSDFYLEIQSNGLPIQIAYNLKLAKMSKELGIKLVGTNDVHYISRDDAEVHDAMLAVRASKGGKTVLVACEDRFRYETFELYLKTRAQLEETFEKFHPDLGYSRIKEALDSTVEIAEKVEGNVIVPRKQVLPVVEIAERFEGNHDWALWELVREGWKWRKIDEYVEGRTGEIDWLEGEDKEEISLKEVYQARVRYEMKLITNLGFSRYFLVVQDLVSWARKNGIRTGPGRGSVAGSLCAYLIGITSVDSVKYNCPFSRFISETRIDVPDVDCDFPTNKRSEVIRYLKDKYGHDKVASISNFARLGKKQSIRDLGRVHGVPYFETEKVVGYMDDGGVGDARSQMTLAQIFEEFEECKIYKAKYSRCVADAIALEGNIKFSSVHAAGIVISDKPIRELVPVQYKRENSEPADYVVSYDKDMVEEMGLLKLDVLGINALTYIQTCLDLVEERTGEKIEPEDLEPDDPEVYEAFRQGHTELVWQLSQPSATSKLKELKPDKFDHIVALSSLIRPGPLYSGVTNAYIARRHGRRAKGMHKIIDKMLPGTYGLAIYQEDVTKIFHDLGGFSWADADAVRKGVAKKKIELMEVWKPQFLSGVQENGLSKSDALKIWSQLVEFSKYSFNRSHSVSYSLLSYWTMYLKLKYPLEFIAAALMAEGKEDKKRAYIKEGARLGVIVTAPDVSVSGETFTIDPRKKNVIRAGLIDVKGVGPKIFDDIRAKQPFESVSDFLARTNANKTAFVRLCKVGAFDELHPNPKVLVENIDEIVKARKKKTKFPGNWDEIEFVDCAPYTEDERDKFCHDYLSLPPRIHPSIALKKKIGEKCPIEIMDIKDLDEFYEVDSNKNRHVLLVGICTRLNFFDGDVRGEDGELVNSKMVRLSLEDDTGYTQVSPDKWRGIGEKNLKEGESFACLAGFRAPGKMNASLLVHLGSLDLNKSLSGQERRLFYNPLQKWIDSVSENGLAERFPIKRKKFSIAVNIIDVRKKVSRANNLYYVVTGQDCHNECREFLVWDKGWKKYGEMIKPGAMLAIRIYRPDKNEKYRGISYFLDDKSEKRNVDLLFRILNR